MDKFEIKLNPSTKKATDILFKNGKTLQALSIEELLKMSEKDVKSISFENGDIEYVSNYDQIHVIYSLDFPQKYHDIKENHTSLVDEADTNSST